MLIATISEPRRGYQFQRIRNTTKTAGGGSNNKPKFEIKPNFQQNLNKMLTTTTTLFSNIFENLQQKLAKNENRKSLQPNTNELFINRNCAHCKYLFIYLIVYLYICILIYLLILLLKDLCLL